MTRPGPDNRRRKGGNHDRGRALLDHDSFDVTGAWEADRGDQFFGYDGWWHLGHDTVITSEWATLSMIENGLSQPSTGTPFTYFVREQT